MHLWTEYEGNTLAGYRIGRLTRSEGRSAFFLTTTEEGQPGLLRLTESHFDEGELIGRWQKAAVVSHPGLQQILHAGRTTFDGVALACCLLEASDASLADVLRERVLSTEETTEVAEAVAGALAALHAAGLVHGHVDPTNVFAVGEAVKLRSDCVRECTGDFEADTEEAREALRQRDVHDLGLLLRRCLTPQWQETSAMPLPAPFDRIVRRALNGTVTAAGIVTEMEALKPVAPVLPKPVAPVTPVRTAVAPAVVRETNAAAAVPTPTKAADPIAAMRRKFVPGAAASAGATRANTPDDVMASLGNGTGTARGERPEQAALPGMGLLHRSVVKKPADVDRSPEETLERVRNNKRHDAGTASMGGVMQGFGPVVERLRAHKVWIASGAAAAVVCFALWHTMAGSNPASAASSAPVSASAAPVVTHVPVATPSSERTPVGAASRPVQPARPSVLSTDAQAGWHVIAYTYNYEKQAEAKALQLQQKYVSMQPHVFSPTGRAPFFVALGEPSDAASAMELRNRARQAGLPRDTYARNFKGRG